MGADGRVGVELGLYPSYQPLQFRLIDPREDNCPCHYQTQPDLGCWQSRLALPRLEGKKCDCVKIVENVVAYIRKGTRLIVFRHVHSEAGIQVPVGTL